MNNIAGTVPVWIKMARANLDLNDKKQAEVLQFLDEIDTATRRLLQKAQEVREATKQRAREPVEVNALVNNAIKRAMASQPNAGERILVEKELGSGLPKIEVERDSFIDTLTSIVKNGLESMSNRGTLRVLTRHTRKTGNPSIEIVVSDSGVGISEENLNKIFDPFFTTKETGMGFGLWRDKTVIEELGGQINVDSALAKGTTFTIRLPVK
jgi:two-component system NtrC family sensor kinase